MNLRKHICVVLYSCFLTLKGTVNLIASDFPITEVDGQHLFIIVLFTFLSKEQKGRSRFSIIFTWSKVSIIE